MSRPPGGPRSGPSRPLLVRWRRPVSLLLLLLFLPQCTTYRVIPGVPPAPIPDGRPKLRFVLQDSTRLVLQRPAMAGDSVVGFTWSSAARELAESRIAWRQVVRVEMQRSDFGKTALYSGIVLAGMLLIGAAWALDNDSWWGSGRRTGAQEAHAEPRRR